MTQDDTGINLHQTINKLAMNRQTFAEYLHHKAGYDIEVDKSTR